MKARVLVALLIVAVLGMSETVWAGGGSSGFIKDLPALTPDADRPGAMSYRKDGVDLSAYKKVEIDPIEIWMAPDSEEKGVDADEAKAIADMLRQIITKELEPAYAVVDQPGQGVLGVRLAVTNVHMRTKKRGLLGYTPIGFVVTTAGNLSGMRMELKEATIEAEVLDGATNERLAVVVERLVGEKKDEATSWEAVQKALQFYAKRFRGRLDVAHGAQ